VQRVRVSFRSWIVFLGCALTAVGHHSTTMFDFSREVTYQGTVNRLEWTNPHVTLFLDTVQSGLPSTVRGESGSPLALQKRGWSSTMVHPGDKITIKGNPSKEGVNIFWIVTITTADGKVYDAGRAPDNN